jgi:hypothetical protein
MAVLLAALPASSAVILYAGNASGNSSDWTSAVTGLGASTTSDMAPEAFGGAGATRTLLGSSAGLNLNFQPDNLYFMGVDDILFTSGGSSEIPEPSTFLLLGAGLAAAAGMRRMNGA